MLSLYENNFFLVTWLYSCVFTFHVLCIRWQMVDAWGGWSLFQGLLRTLKQVASKHGVSIATVGVKYILDQVNLIYSISRNLLFLLI